MDSPSVEQLPVDLPATRPSTGADGARLVQAQPALLRRADSIWARAERARDELYGAVQRACAAEGFDALVIQSPPYLQPTWVKFECWVPREDRLITERGAAIITIVPKEFHEFEFEYQLELTDRGQPAKLFPPLRQFDAAHAAQLVRYMLRRAPMPSFDALELRRVPWQVWKPVNRVTALRIDWSERIALMAIVVGFFLITYRGFGLLLVVGGGVAIALLKRRGVVVRSSGKPETEPRNLHRVDSWQTVISGLGADSELLLVRFMEVLKHPPTDGFASRVERVWSFGLDGKIEREQIVITLGRGILFCQIQPYDKELYIGWDAHLNSGQWVERTLQKGVDTQTERLTAVNTVVPGWQQLSQFDVTDLSTLIEWTHAKLVQLIKRLMEERKIDQEVDFHILRGERQGLTKDEPPEDAGASGVRNVARTLGRKLQRTG
ncbi:MAG: hypothetical protein M3081_01335 [Gemmatimonadota bacterium]|nr:hypothetical protein [Gemmatimonadota bacterium]